MNLRTISRFVFLCLVTNMLPGVLVAADQRKVEVNLTFDAQKKAPTLDWKFVDKTGTPTVNWQSNIKPALKLLGGASAAAYLGYKIRKFSETEKFETNHPYLKYCIDKISPWVSWVALLGSTLFVPAKLQSWGFVNQETSVALVSLGMMTIATKAQSQILPFMSEKIKPIAPKTTLGDVAGKPHPDIAELVEYLESYQVRKDYKDTDTPLPKGILLYGPPGTGKTLMAKAIAGQAGVKLFSVSVSNVNDALLGQAEKNIVKVFTDAKETALFDGVAIIFIDEIDSLAKKRRSGIDSVADKVLSTLLQQMDGVRPCNNVIIIATTNMPTALDDAILRPGRFDKIIKINLPNKKQRKDILDLYLSKKTIYEHHQDQGEKEKCLEELATSTKGLSAAALKEIVQAAARRAIHIRKQTGAGKAILTDALLQEAARKMVTDPLRGVQRNRSLHASAPSSDHDAEAKQNHASEQSEEEED